MSIFSKIIEASEAALDGYIAKAKSSISNEEMAERKGMIEVGFPDEQQYGYKERTSLVGPGILKNMARKDSIVIAILNTRLAQIAAFCKPQKDKYSQGWDVVPNEPADISGEEKMRLADPSLDDEARAQLKHELDQKRQKLKEKQDKDIAKIKEFITHCGMPAEETDTTYKRWDFERWVKSIVWDRLVYNYSATELVPTKDGDTLHHFYPVSAGTIRFVSSESANLYQKMLEPIIADRKKLQKRFDSTKPFRYVQIIRGKVMAAFTEDELIFEAAHPTVDPEDNGYAPGELELLIQIVTAHLFAEAHNRNFFTQGIGTKGILHIKGDNISRGQLEAFKRQWFNQVVNTRNSFRPPIIGMAEDVKWVSLAQTNREMEFEQWMNYLIRISCAIYQIDPAEINFDISKVGPSTLNEGNNEERLRSSRDKGLKPLLDYVENLLNNNILCYWNKDLNSKYKFKFVGFDAETRQQEIDRLEKETRVWKTLNEARVEMGFPPVEAGDLVLNATFTQYLAQKQMAEQQQAMQDQQRDMAGQDPNNPEGNPDENTDDMSEVVDQIDAAISSADAETDEKDQQADKEAKTKAQEETKKSLTPTVIEYFTEKDEE